jgi:hypothetical protein
LAPVRDSAHVAPQLERLAGQERTRTLRSAGILARSFEDGRFDLHRNDPGARHSRANQWQQITKQCVVDERRCDEAIVRCEQIIATGELEAAQ